VSDKVVINEEDENDVRYHGDGFHLGQCGIRIKRFHFSDAGEWRCGVGRVSESMKDAVKSFNVEVKASFMMAITKQIEDFTRNSIVLQCRAIPRGSLRSCHFLTPTGNAFSINEGVTQGDAIDGLYYFDPNRKLSDGYCTVVIKELNKDQHAGRWTCAGRILGHDEESYDTIYVTVDGLRGASFSFLTLAIVLPTLAVMALSIVGYKQFMKYKQRTNGELLDQVSMNTMQSNNSSTPSSNESVPSQNDSVATSYSA